MVSGLPQKDSYTIGVISDTHGRLPDAAVKLLRRADLIVHAGDVGEPYILSRLEQLAPVIAVRGNMDRASWADGVKQFEAFEVAGHTIYALHDLGQLDCDPTAAGIAVVISGHTHRPTIERKKNVLYLNPGSASRPKHGMGATVALLHLSRGSVDAAIVELFG
jgi:hypothetical protein